MDRCSNVKIKKMKLFCDVLIVLFASCLSSFGLWIFVYPAKFAPSGIDGIATMLYEITEINAGIFSLIFNLPLLIIAYFVLKKKYVIYTFLFTIFSSLILILLEYVHFYQFVTENDLILVSIFSGVLLGFRTGLMLKIGGSSGGVDILGGIVQKKYPFLKIEKIITFICYLIIGSSYFLYKDLNCILLSLVQMFVFEQVVNAVLRDNRNAVELKIVTKNPDELKDDIIVNLKHGATLISSKGMYTNKDSSMVISVINVRQIPEFMNIIKKYPDTFVYYSDVVGVKGNFRWLKDEEAK